MCIILLNGRAVRVDIESEEEMELTSSNNTNNTTGGSSRKKPQLLFDSSSAIYVIQAADKAYAERMESKMKANQQWAKCMNYTYKLVTLTKTGNNIYAEKVKAIYDTLQSVQENDWIIFLDGDVTYQKKKKKGEDYSSCDDDAALEKILPLETEFDNQPCEFVTTTSAHSINTGVVLLKSVNSTRHLVKRWLELQSKPGDNLLTFGAADQLTLQEAVMEKYLGNIYTGSCGMKNSQPARNYCFRDHLPQEYRSFKNICLVSCANKHPIQCSDCGPECNRTEALFFHDTKRERNIAKDGFG